jgi:hypothetical protein
MGRNRIWLQAWPIQWASHNWTGGPVAETGEVVLPRLPAASMTESGNTGGEMAVGDGGYGTTAAGRLNLEG